MSHFTVLVALLATDSPDLASYVHKTLDEVLHQYSENLEIPRYKDYEAEDPNEYRLAALMRKDGQLPAEGDVTWPQVIAAQRIRYPNDDESEQLHYDADDDRPAYTWSEYNPKSKWDWWAIGGRWPARFVPALGADPADVLMPERSGYPFEMLSDEAKARKGVDGGRKHALDLTLMREVAAGEAATDWRRVMAALRADEAAVKALDSYVTWDEFVARVKDETLTIEAAREQYHTQPVYMTMKALFPEHWDVPGAEAYYLLTEEQYALQAANAVVPGFAYIDVAGEWHEAGRMGWFGFSTDTPQTREEYNAKVNADIDALPADVVLVSIDCHI